MLRRVHRAGRGGGRHLHVPAHLLEELRGDAGAAAGLYRAVDVYRIAEGRLLQDGRYEIGTALGLFKSLVGMAFVLGSNWIVKVLSHDEYGIL